MSENKTLSSTFKSADTEEWLDIHFTRPIGLLWAKFFNHFNIHPNVVTIISIVLGAAAGVFFYFENLWLNVLGILLLMWANFYDSADGQLARMTKQYSRLGRILDGVSGDFWFISIYIALCLRQNMIPGIFMEYTWLIWALAVIAGLCHMSQAAIADYYRQIHLFFLKGEAGSELDSSKQMLDKFNELSWKSDFFEKLTYMFYSNYTVRQEKRTPWMQAMRAALAKRFNGAEASAEFRGAFRIKSKPLMKYTNMLSFSTRSYVLFISIFTNMPWIYFTFEIVVLGIMYLYITVQMAVAAVPPMMSATIYPKNVRPPANSEIIIP